MRAPTSSADFSRRPGGSHHPAVVLRLRGRADIGSTFLGIVERYRGEIEQSGGVLLLAGVGPELHEQLERTGVLDAIGDDRVCEAQVTLTASVSVAVDSAERWLREHGCGASDGANRRRRPSMGARAPAHGHRSE